MTDGPVVGIVGNHTDAVVDAVTAAGGVPVADAAAAVVDESASLVAVGESGLLALARAGPSTPVLPVAAGRGIRSVALDSVGAAVESFLATEFEPTTHPILDVQVGDRTRAQALLDVMLVSAEPAQISEYAVESDDERVAQFRADGVALATPAGSSGYASAAGGPVLDSRTDATSVVPIAPFETDNDLWVLPSDGLRLTVERDEPVVHLLADDRIVSPVSPEESVTVSPGDSMTVAVVPSSQSPYRSR